jgi:hypothetical protein
MAMLPSSLPLNKWDGTAFPASEQNKVRDDHMMHHVVGRPVGSGAVVGHPGGATAMRCM